MIGCFMERDGSLFQLPIGVCRGERPDARMSVPHFYECDNKPSDLLRPLCVVRDYKLAGYDEEYAFYDRIP